MRAHGPTGPRTLMLIGGAEDKLGRRAVLSRFVAEAGGRDASIVVVATASAIGEEAVELYRAVFPELGAAEVTGLLPTARNEASDPSLVAPLERATGVFLTGGNQGKLTGIILRTPLEDAIHAAYQRGAVIAGTSAGASAVASHMVAFGSSGDVPLQRMAQLTSGLGLLDRVIVDQHFNERSRLGRLLYLVAHSPSHLGLGIDEDTAAVVTDERWLEVIGRGAVTVVDGAGVESNAYVAKRNQPLLVSGVVLHVLPRTACFDLEERRLTDQQPEELYEDELPPPPLPGEHRGVVVDPRLADRVDLEGIDDRLLEGPRRAHEASEARELRVRRAGEERARRAGEE